MAIPTQGRALDACGGRFSTGDAWVVERTLWGQDGLEPEFQLCDLNGLAGAQASHQPSLGLSILLRKMGTETPRSRDLRTKREAGLRIGQARHQRDPPSISHRQGSGWKLRPRRIPAPSGTGQMGTAQPTASSLPGPWTWAWGPAGGPAGRGSRGRGTNVEKTPRRGSNRRRRTSSHALISQSGVLQGKFVDTAVIKNYVNLQMNKLY